MAFTPRAARRASSGEHPTARPASLRGVEPAAGQRPGAGQRRLTWSGRSACKMWADGSPWVGNIATSFPYLDTPSTRAIGLDAHHRGHANYTPEQLADLAEAYFPQGLAAGPLRARRRRGDDGARRVGGPAAAASAPGPPAAAGARRHRCGRTSTGARPRSG
ncbi:hypothetical protein ACU686_08910 [Yinghuangia aomiensis]